MEKVEKKETFVQAITKILVSKGSLPSDEAEALQKSFKNSSKEAFDDFLLEGGFVDEDELLSALSEHYHVPGFDVVGYFFEPHLLHMFPKGFLLRNGIVPLEVDENMMTIVATEPDNPELLAKVGGHVSYNIRFRVGIRADIQDAVKEFYDQSLTAESEEPDRLEERLMAQEEERIELEESDFVWDEDFEK